MKLCKICASPSIVYEEIEGSENYPTAEAALMFCKETFFYCQAHIPPLVCGRMGYHYDDFGGVR